MTSSTDELLEQEKIFKKLLEKVLGVGYCPAQATYKYVIA